MYGIRRGTTWVGGAVLALAVAGCSFSIGGAQAVTTERLEEAVADYYEPNDPDDELSAQCEGDLPAEVDATQDCEVTVGEESAWVRTTVTSIEGSEVRFDFATYVPGDEVAAAVEANLRGQGFDIETVTCPDELPGEQSAEMACTVLVDGQEEPVQIEVTAVEGLKVNFNFTAG